MHFCFKTKLLRFLFKFEIFVDFYREDLYSIISLGSVFSLNLKNKNVLVEYWAQLGYVFTGIPYAGIGYFHLRAYIKNARICKLLHILFALIKIHVLMSRLFLKF